MIGRRTVAALAALAVFGAGGGWLARSLLERDAVELSSASRGDSVAGGSAAPAGAAERDAPRHARAQLARVGDPRPVFLADVYERDEVARSSTDSIFTSKGAVRRLEREALSRLIGDDDGRGLAACLSAPEDLEEVVVEWRVVSTDEVVAIRDAAILEPMVTPEQTRCIDELMQGIEARREPGDAPFLRGDRRRIHRVPLGVSFVQSP